MSVINKMLRDLDQRQPRGGGHSVPSDGLAQDTVAVALSSVGASATDWPSMSKRVRMSLWISLGVLLLGGALTVILLATDGNLGLWAALQRSLGVPAEPEAAAPAPTAFPAPSVVASPAAVAAIPASAPAAGPAPVLAAGSTAVLARTVPESVPAPVLVPTTVSRVAQAKEFSPVPVTLGLRMDMTLAPRKSPDRSATPERPPAQSSELPRPPTPTEALERAQALWNSGARDAAQEVLQEAVAVVERTGAGVSHPQGNPVLLPLVRELTRLQLSDSRHGAVLDLLTRLEPQLGTVPDLWAIRANAAQRLGRHQDSVHSYMVALQSRPNEQRWLLGAAVSLAALGQSTSATEMAVKARAAGPISSDVLSYLRQMGVLLGEK